MYCREISRVVTELGGWVGNTAALYSRGPVFKPRSWDYLSWLWFIVLSSDHPGTFRVSSLSYMFSVTYYFSFIYINCTLPLLHVPKILFQILSPTVNFVHAFPETFLPCWVSGLTLLRLYYCGNTPCTRKGFYENKFRSSSINVIRNNSVGIAIGYGMGGRGSIPDRCKIFLFSKTSRPAVGPTQPPTQWVPGGLSPGVKPPGAWSWSLISI
jgi:hypothetical protein